MPDDDPISEGHDAAVQVATIGSTLLGELARRAAARTRDSAEAASHHDTADRSRQAATEARAAARWAPILDRDYRSHATTRDTLDAWFAAEPRSSTDPQAARATALAEIRLRRTAPEAMADYDAERGRGTGRMVAMQRITPLLDVVVEDRDRTLEGLAGALVNRASTEEAAADRLRSRPDDPATPDVDERTAGLAAAAVPEALGAAGRARATATIAAAVPGTPDFPVLITTVPLRSAQPVGAMPIPASPVVARARGRGL